MNEYLADILAILTILAIILIGIAALEVIFYFFARITMLAVGIT